MAYSRQQFEDAIDTFGEVFFVLDSGSEYTVHGNAGYEVSERTVRVDGMRDDEYIIAEFPLDAIEHHYAYRQV